MMMMIMMMMMMTAFDVLCAESTFPIVCGGKEKPITTLLPHNSHEERTAGDVLLLFISKSTLIIGNKTKIIHADTFKLSPQPLPSSRHCQQS